MNTISVIALTAIACLIACTGNDAARAKNAVDLASYQTDLDACRAKGKDAGSYAVYEGCADAVDAKHGRKP